MKTLNHTIGKLLAVVILVASLSTSAQTNLQFTAVKATSEGAMQLYWQSEPHHLYEIDEADALVDTNTGSITWNKLYDNYPSHGTNTFIGDFGNYNLAPQIPHPKNSPNGGQLYPFLRMDVTIDIGGQNVRLAIDCPIIDESKL